MIAQVLLPRNEPYMLGYLHGELPKLERALGKKIPTYIKGDLICAELDISQKWEILCGLELLTGLDEVYLITHPKTPPLYQAGVVYEIEAPGLEEWLTTPVLYRRKRGDCEDLACTLCAERRIRGQKCNPYVTKKRNVWHIRSEMASVGRRVGYIEDPSRVLGMGR